MTTLEERRDWMRAGCPVEPEAIRVVQPEFGSKVEGQCSSFRLLFERLLGNEAGIYVECRGCSEWETLAGIQWNSRNSSIMGARDTVNGVFDWIIGHVAGRTNLSHAQASSVFIGVDWTRVQKWAETLMRRQDAMRLSGWVGERGSVTRGLILEQEVSV